MNQTSENSQTQPTTEPKPTERETGKVWTQPTLMVAGKVNQLVQRPISGGQ